MVNLLTPKRVNSRLICALINNLSLYLKLLVNKKVSTSKTTTSVSSGNQVSTTTSRPLLPGLRLPCSCVEGQCGCCTGVLLDQFNQKACLNVSYEPDDFSLTAMMSMNGRVLYKRTVSGNLSFCLIFY